MVERDVAAHVADVYLKELGLTPDKFSDIRTLPTEALLAAYYRTQPKVGPIRAGFVDNFGPVIDPVVLPHHPFWPDAPEMTADVPVLLGWNRTEMTLFAQGNPAMFSLDEAGMEKAAKGIFGDGADEIVDTYRAEYPKASPTERLFLMWSDYPTMAFANHIAESRARKKRGNTYLYRFDWQTPVMGGKLRTPHTLEIPFVFNNTDTMANFTGGGQEAAQLAGRMSEAWVRFAATGDPNSRESGLPEWRPYDPDGRATMLLDVKSRLVNDPQRVERELLYQRMVDTL
jgi:para-nitrobenzyl esterase